MDENATPRGIIRGVLTTGGIGESVKLSPRRTPRAADAKKTPTDPPSRTEVATRLLTRSRSAKRKATADNTQTPSDSTTPRTLIAGFLQTAPVAKSVVKGKRQKTVEKPYTRRTSRSTSQAEDNTPRTIIQNFLREAFAESPEKPDISTSSDVEDKPVTQQSDAENRFSLVTSVAADDDDAGTVTETDEQSVAMTTSHARDHVTLMEAATSMLLDSYEEDEGATQNTSEQETQEEVESLQSTGTHQTLETDTVIRAKETETSRQWRDLVTPQLPLGMSSAGQLSRSIAAERSVGERPFFGGKPPTGKAGARSSKRPSGPRMPSALVKSIFQHFSKAKLSKEALQVVENGSNLFFKQVSSDLMAYCRHAHRTTIELADVELLMKRQGFITDNQSLYALVEKYLPLEYRQEIIPTVQAGNKIVLK